MSKIKIPQVTVDWETETVTDISYWVPISSLDSDVIEFDVIGSDGVTRKGFMNKKTTVRYIEQWTLKSIPMFYNMPEMEEKDCLKCGNDMQIIEIDNAPFYECSECNEYVPVKRLEIDKSIFKSY